MTDEEFKECSIPDCADPARDGQRYCPPCHAKYMRGWRARRKMQVKQLVAEVFRLREQNRELREQIQNT
jgi:hypothetical protein